MTKQSTGGGDLATAAPEGHGCLLVSVTSAPAVAAGLTARMLASVRDQDIACRVLLVARAVDQAALDALPDQPDAILAVPERIALSRARNLGLAAAAERGWLGEARYVSFPDDDCWYPPRLLGAIAQRLEQGAAGVIVDYRPDPVIGPGNESEPRPLGPAQTFQLATSNNSFYRSAAFAGGLRFDERLGLGAPYGSSEDLDVALEVARDGEILYLPGLAVGHPLTPGKAAAYFPGNIAVLAKHATGAWWARRLLLRQAMVGLLWLLQGRLSPRLAVGAAKAGYRMVRPRRYFVSALRRAPALAPSIRPSIRGSESGFEVCSVGTRHAMPETLEALAETAVAGIPVHVWLLDDIRLPQPLHALGVGQGAKFHHVRTLLAQCDPNSDVVIIDDDVEWLRGDLGRFVALARRAGLDLAQPAHGFRSYSSHALTIARPTSIARLTTFVEIGPVTYVSHRARRDVLAADVTPDMGYGAEARWWDLAQRKGFRLGVIDAARIRHLRPVGVGYDVVGQRQLGEGALADAGTPSWSSLQRTLERWRPWQRGAPWRR